ncbi:MAG TPA: ribosome biogenesis GTPase Der [Candidatus Eisenbacteria bacterium]|nr:ribosome biogenesis GTPase Der [Candidatus Eisenbacteria bacterium]
MDERHLATPAIAIVGRTNVGKSTLFNRLLEVRKAITSPVPGTTHDINFGHCHWRNKTLTVIDTAGLDLTSKAATDEGLKRQANLAMAKADVIIFVVDAAAGLYPQDRAFAKHLQKSKKTVILVANKADNPGKRRNADDPEWLKLGYGKPWALSAANGTGVGDLLDHVLEVLKLDKLDAKPLPEIDIRVAIIGRPNVGKSSLLNALAGEDRVIVSEIPHTTKEPQDTLLVYENDKGEKKNILVIDTVGIRKKAKVAPGIEKIGVHMSLEELKRADVVLLLVDAEAGVDLQEKKLAGLAETYQAAVLIVVNKWDLADEKKLGKAEAYAQYVYGQLPFFSWAPVTFVAAKTGAKVGRMLAYITELAAQRDRTIPQEQLDKFVEKLKKLHHASFAKGGDRFGKKGNRPKVYGMTQTGTKPPEFMVVVHDKETLHPSFVRFIENRMREEFGFAGTPVRVLAREID